MLAACAGELIIGTELGEVFIEASVTQEARYQQRNKKPKGSKRKRLFQQPHCKAPHVMFEFEKNKSLRPTTATNKLRTRQEVLLVPWFFYFPTPESAWFDRSLPRRHSGDERSFHESLITAAATAAARSALPYHWDFFPSAGPAPGVSTTGAGSRNVRLITHSVSTVQSVKIPVKMGIVSLDRRTLDAQFSAGKCPNQIVEMNFLTFKLMNFQV